MSPDLPSPPPRLDSFAATLRSVVGLLNEEELAAMLDLKGTQTLQVWRTNRRGPKYTKLGKTVFYRISDVQEWIAQNVEDHA